ncbi:MAG: tRNA pseudouridine(38-40) synthase TruA [Ignavibacteria bacterium]|nr:tRNA pseudouridine(38-40) synthase TruA [Ignavibacteria bacterium]
MWNTKLTIEYDGTDYVGWQIQPNGRSIQGELEGALGQILQQSVQIVGAGRTDAGVHARGQVANFKTSQDVEPRGLVKSLNGVLPEDIVVLSAGNVEESFHARYSAKARVYRYELALQPTALRRNYSWYVGGFALDMDLLNCCAALIVGEKDFRSFCKANSGAEDFRCSVLTAGWKREGSLLVFEIMADRFLYGMVRALVGTMVEIGRGYRPLEDFGRILDARDRREAGMAPPAKGLFLERVIY